MPHASRSIRKRLIAFLLLASCAVSHAKTYHIDPKTGSPDGDGSEAKPWQTLAGVIEAGKFSQVQAGDTVLLRTGHHGAVTLKGENAQPIVIAAGENQRPTLSRLTISSGANWLVRGLTISPSLGGEPYKGSIVTLGEGGASRDIVIEDCFIHTALDAGDWDAARWMSANSGIHLGRHGKGLVVRNCYVLNTRFGITLSSYDALCEGNVVSDFSADGIRATRNGQIVRYNVIKNVYVSAKDGDDNHDDGIQCFLFNKGTGTVKGVQTIGNIIIAHENPSAPLAAGLQGIGYFDGPLVDFVVEGNVVEVNHWHGIALYDAQNARVENNVVWTRGDGKARAWIMFGTKQKQARDNTARGNFACSFKLDQPGTVQENNALSSEAIYDRALERALKTISEKFGVSHPVAQRERLTKAARPSP